MTDEGGEVKLKAEIFACGTSPCVSGTGRLTLHRFTSGTKIFFTVSPSPYRHIVS
jgi:hypothetical protein